MLALTAEAKILTVRNPSNARRNAPSRGKPSSGRILLPDKAIFAMATNPSASVPLLDINRQNTDLRKEILAAIARVYDSGAFVLGPECEALEKELAAYCGTEDAVGCASGSDALLLSLMALGVGAGDEVVLPSFTFFATAGAVWRLGATPVFVDIEPDSFNLDPADLERKISPQTKVVIPVHLFGLCADITAIRAIVEPHGAVLLEDAAQAVGAEHAGRRAGSLGTAGCFSFYPTKNLGGFGDGGMITTNDAALAKRLRLLRNHGAEARYYHHDVGINSRLDSIQAAVLRIKLRHLDDWAAAREANAKRYTTLFEQTGLAQTLGLPQATPGEQHVWNQYTVRVPGGQRDALQQYLSKSQVGTAIYYPVPLHLQECFASLGYESGSLPQTEQAADEVLSLPIFAEMTEAEQDVVVETMARFFAQQAGANHASAA